MNLAALQHSAFLQSLGWAIMNSLWQTAVLWTGYYLVNVVYKNAPSKFKNNCSTILLFSSFTWFCITLFSKYFAIVNQTDITITQLSRQNHVFTNVANLSWQSILVKLSAVLPYLSVAYLLLLVFLGARLINSFRFTYFIKTNGLQKPGVEWKLFTERVARHMGIAKKIKLWVSQHIDVPATIGFIKPVILIPLASINQLSEDQVEAIILHELSHIKRNDYLVNLFISIIETLLFFNPFVVLLAKIIKSERENCCDDFVIQYKYDRHSYASALLSLEHFRIKNMHLALTATSGKKQLLHRIKRIMEIKSNANFNYGQKLLALLLMTGVFCSIAWLSPSKNEKKNLQANEKADAKFSVRKIKNPEKTQSTPVILKGNKITTTGENLHIKKEKTGNNNEPDISVGYQPLEKENKNADAVKWEIKKDIDKANTGENNFKYRSPAENIAAPEPLLYQNENTQAPNAKSFEENKGIKHIMPERINIKKLQAEIDKQYYSFSFEWGKIQDELRHTYKDRKLNMPLHFYENIVEGNLENLINTEIKNSGQKNLNRAALLKRVAGTYTLSKNLLPGFVDTLISVNTETATGSIKRMQGKNLNDLQIVPVKIGRAPSSANRLSYSIITNDNTDKPNVPVKQNPHRHDNIRIEYKNDVLVINGKKIYLPDTNKMLALLKTKKFIFSGDNDLIEIHVKE